jgi:hypothetical protein
MSEFIREVDEEYRRDQIAQIWKRYSGLIIAVAVLFVAGVGGWRYWQHSQQLRSEAAAVRYEDAVRSAQDGKGEDAAKALSALAPDSPAGYRLLSRFRLAGELGKQNSADGASAFDALAADASVDATWQDLARLRAAMLRMDTAEASAVQPLERLASPTGTWRHTAREMLGLIGLHRGDMEAAGKWFDQIAADRETPPSLRGRLEIYAALVAGGPVQVTQ